MSFPTLITAGSWSSETAAPYDNSQMLPPLISSTQEPGGPLPTPHPYAPAATVFPPLPVLSDPGGNTTTFSRVVFPSVHRKGAASTVRPARKEKGGLKVVKKDEKKSPCPKCHKLMCQGNVRRHIIMSCKSGDAKKKGNVICVCGKVLSRRDALKRHIIGCRIATELYSSSTSPDSSESSASSPSTTMAPSGEFTSTTEFTQQPAQQPLPVGLDGGYGFYPNSSQPFGIDSAVPRPFLPFGGQPVCPSFETGNLNPVYSWWDPFYCSQMAVMGHDGFNAHADNSPYYYYPYYANTAASREITLPLDINNVDAHAATTNQFESIAHGLPASTSPEWAQFVNNC